MVLRRRRLFAVVLAATALAGCDGGDAEQAAPKQPADTTTARARAADACVGEVGRLACEMSLERKVAQLFLVGPAGAALVRERALGGVVLEPGGGRDAGAVVRSVRRRDVTRIEPFVLAVQEGGEHNAVPGAAPFAAPADVGSAGEAAAGARDSARSLRRLGVTGVLGPVVDVGVEGAGALGTRIYSDDPDEVSAYARRAVAAYRRERVFSAVSHFPGVGSADASTAEAPATVGLTPPELRERDLLPFAAAIKAGVPAVVVGHALYPTTDFVVPASLSRETVTTLLRGELGFDGVAITDDLADPAVSLTTSAPRAAVEAVGAGADLVFISGPVGAQRAAYTAVLRAVRRGRLSRDRVDQAVRRVLAAKSTYGLVR